METGRDPLLVALAVETGLVEPDALAGACTEWADRGGGATLGDVLVEKGLLTVDDWAGLRRHLDRRLAQHGGDLAATLAATVDPVVRKALETVEAASVQRTLSIGSAPTQSDAGPVRLAAIGADPDERGRYTKTRLHATGGIGRVWLARDASLGREVALKELRPEREGNRAAWSRFVIEAKITGQLEHPGIIPVYELSPGDDEHPAYYTMRFVRGRTLTEAIAAYHGDRRAGRATPLGLATLLDAFVGICHAVAYAHARGVIHRDLKGQNVVLGDFGEVIVLDWGLAKIVDGADAGLEPATLPAGEASAYKTMEGRAVGTPAYMSPEQAAGRLDQVDQRSDVYGLGAILYEILTGRAPFEGVETADVLRRVIGEAPKPPREIVAEVALALEAVCLHALAKPREDRYAAAKDLADDVRRWLADEPVSVYPDPWPARAGRWARRHRTAVAAAAGLLVAATLALGVGTVLVGRERDEARRQRNEAVAQRAEAISRRAEAIAQRAEADRHRGIAQAQRRQARSAVDEMYTEVAQKWLEDRLDPVQEQFLRKALAYYESFAGQEADDRDVRLERGRAYQRVGDILHKLGRQPEAERAYRRAQEVLGGLTADASDPGPARASASAGTSLALLLAARGDFAEAEALFLRAIDVLAPSAAEGPGSTADRLALARAHKGLADLHRVKGRNDDAEAAYRRAIAILDAPASTPPGDLDARPLLAATFDRLGLLLKETGRLPEATTSFVRGLDLTDRLVAEFPTLPRLREALGNGLRSLGLLYMQTGRHDDAMPALRRAVEVTGRLAGDFPHRPEYRRDLGKGRMNLAILLASRHEYAEAETHYRAAAALYERLAAEVPGVLQYRHDLARTLNNLGLLLKTMGQVAEAEATSLRAVEVYGDLVAKAPDVPAYRKSLAQSQMNLSFVLESVARFDDAVRAVEGAGAVIERLAAEFPTMPDYRADRAKVASLRGQFRIASSRRRAEEVLAALTAPADDASLRERAGRAIRLASSALKAAVERQDADRSYRRAIAIHGGLVDEFPRVVEYRNNLGIALSNLAELRPADAESIFGRALALYAQLAADQPGAPGHRQMLAIVHSNLGEFHESGGRMSEAEAAVDRAVGLLEPMAAGTASMEIRSHLGQMLANQGRLRLALRGPAEARPPLERAATLRRTVYDANPRDPSSLSALREVDATLARVDLDLGDHDAAARLADELARLPGDRGVASRESARLLARCVALVDRDESLPADRRRALSDAYADRAIALLREVPGPIPSLGRLEDDEGLRPLRSRSAFQKLLVASGTRPAGGRE